MRADRIGAIILGRLDSERLPRKLLAEVGGITLIEQVARRIPRDVLDTPPVLATSERQVDDDLAEEGERLGLTVFRGDAADVAGRFVAAAQASGLDAAFRINADSPFLDPGLWRRATALRDEAEPVLVTNLARRSYPYGVAVELIHIQSLANVLATTVDPEDREHVTRALYRELPDRFVRNLSRRAVPEQGDVTGIRMTVDTADDLARLRAFCASQSRPLHELGFEDALASDFYRASR